MIRALLLTALCAFLAAIGFFSIAAATGGRDFGKFMRNNNFEDFDEGAGVAGDGPQTVKILTWTGGDELTVRIPAIVHYTQGPMTSLAVTGPKGTVESIVVRDGALTFDRRVHNVGRIEVTMMSPDITQFTMRGAQELDITGYNHPRLEAKITGAGSIVAKGAADEVEMKITGAGEMDFGALPSKRLEIHITGAGDAIAAPSDEAEIHIAGAGDVTLKTRPKKLESHIAGPGEIHQPDA